jgi:hypothetical protein
MKIKTDPAIPINEATDRYILSDKSVVLKNDVRVNDKFVEYGPEDIDYLLYAGIIKLEKRIIICTNEQRMFFDTHGGEFDPCWCH